MLVPSRYYNCPPLATSITMDFAVIDPRTAKVAIQLQLEDIAEILRTIDKSMGQGAIDGVANLDRIQHDLVQQLMELESQILVISILRTEHQERVTIENLLNEEKQIAGDHELAMGLAGLSLSGADTASRPLDTPYNDEDDAQWEMAKQLYTSAFDQDNIDSAPEENSVQHIVADRSPYQGLRTIAADEARKTLSSEVLAKCNACFEPWPVKDTIHLHCMHIYCRTCLLDLFTSAILNPTLFPPRCCRQPIPLETCRAMLPKELIKDFDLKVEELATPNPTYCANADCSKFIRPKEIVDDIGSCVFCEHKTCIQCKNKSHDGLCPNDPHVQLLMDVAKRSKWQVCNNCNNMVELETGCFHMT